MKSVFPDGYPRMPDQAGASRLAQRIDAIRQRDQGLSAWAWLPQAPLQDMAPSQGPLHGMLFGVKDVIDVRGMPTRCGSALEELDVPRPFDAVVVAQLRQAGAVPIGKTVTAEYAYVTPGPTRNPWNAVHTPGGSSSGSAAAVAAGMVPFALGTQTGGSMVRPAAFNGVVGFKPSVGSVHRAGMTVLCETLDTIGWFTRDVALAGQVLDVLCSDAGMARAAVPAMPRIAVLPCRGLGALSAAADAALHLAAGQFQQHGCIVDWHHPDDEVATLQSVHGTVMAYELSRALLPVVQRQPHGLSQPLRETIRRGLSITAWQYQACMRVRADLQARWQDRFDGYDALLTPSAPGEAPAGLQSTGASTFNRIWSLLGWPCLHLPTAMSGNGLPVGVQLVGRLQGDADLLVLGLDWHARLDDRWAGLGGAEGA